MRQLLTGDPQQGFTLSGRLDHRAVCRLPLQLPLDGLAGVSVECRLDGVDGFDSSLPALMQQWHAAAGRQQCRVGFRGLPASLRNLIEAYGLTHLLPDAGPAQS